MGTECSPQTMADIVDATAFDKMKTAKDNHQLNQSNVPEKVGHEHHWCTLDKIP